MRIISLLWAAGLTLAAFGSPALAGKAIIKSTNTTPAGCASSSHPAPTGQGAGKTMASDSWQTRCAAKSPGGGVAPAGKAANVGVPGLDAASKDPAK